MKPIIFEGNGVNISVVGVNRNKSFDCARCLSYTAENCSLKKRLSLNYDPKKLICTEIVLVVANMSDRPISIHSRYWEIVDTEGFSYGGFSLCGDHIKPRTVDPDRWEITPGTQVKCSLVFPEQEEKINIVSLLYSNGKMAARLNLRKPTKKVEALLLAKEAFIMNKNAIRRQTRED